MRTIVEFDGLRLDLETGGLARAGRAVALRPMVARLLVDLVERRHRWVTRAELIHRIWSGRHVSASSCSTLLGELRRDLGDDGRRQSVIRTCRRRGHRFVAPVVTDPVEDTPRGVERVAEASTPKSSFAIDAACERPVRSFAAAHERAARSLEAAHERASRSLDAAARGGPRRLDVRGPGAGPFARDWAGTAADRGWQLHRGRRTDRGCPDLWPWWQIAASLRRCGAPGPGAREAAEWTRLAREIEWAATRAERDDDPAARLRRFALLDGLSRGLRRAAAARPTVLLLEAAAPLDPPTDRVLSFVLANHAAKPLWIVTWSESTRPEVPEPAERIDPVDLATCDVRPPAAEARAAGVRSGAPPRARLRARCAFEPVPVQRAATSSSARARGRPS